MKPDIEKTIREYLPEVIHVSLATVKDNKPWVCEVHYAFDESLNLYYRSLTSRRHSEEIAQNENVAGNIVRQYQPGESPVGVYFEGTAKVLQPGEELDKAFESLDTRLKIGPEKLEEAKDPNGHQFYKVTVKNWFVFGNLDGNGAQKYELAWNGGKK